MFNIFSSYIQEDLFTLDTKKIKKEILNIKVKNKKRIASNYGGWQSESFSKINENFKILFNKINLSVKEIEKNLSLEKKLFLNNYWCNVNYLSCFNRPHNHSGAVLSGVYYVSIPKNSGNLIFQDFNTNKDIAYKFVKNYNNYNSTLWTVSPKENLCVLFPSYLQHYVEPNLNKKERISISFNYGF
tara:strand:+ start:186 stop:743 length:558 start_codon:yes stop_codon:yes gene_type:complete